MTDDDELSESTDDGAASLESNALTRDRLAKYRKVMEDGGFPYGFERTATAADLT